MRWIGLVIVAVSLMLAPLSAETQQPEKMPRIGWISGPVPAQPNSMAIKNFTEGLREAGYIVNQNVVMDVRTPGEKVEQYPDLAARLVAEGVDIIVAVNPLSIDAVTKATRTIPVIALDTESDPVARGWVASLSRPGGNLTGFFLDFPELSGKHLQFLKEVRPSLTRVAVLGDARVNELQIQATEAAARGAGLTLERQLVKDANEIPGAIAGAANRGARALVALTSPVVNTNLDGIASLAIKHRLPAICFFTRFGELGGLLTYGADFQDLYRRAGGYVAKILKGGKPGELPVQRPMKFLLVINLKTAKALGLTIPQSLLLRADQVIE